MTHPFIVILFCFGIGAAVMAFCFLMAVWVESQNEN